ncbi:Hypothetical protein c5183 [Escherichia coli CFT073]|uniref:Uncharacterized protein n=1 Tax=Escherichia coli O6:H1 (strain CFT073 / ATCC 700928 / UPEC) TaxID=199310 RepID=A0A0H2VC25_ECOL6|nr:Hypothetical protein c3587 [Escherichia coli CFT073]AAN83605.1 Hypothetical protein c5183 [Escherichia coli CFT073]
MLWEVPGFSRLLPSVSSSAMPNRPAFTPVTFRWPGRAASSVPLKVRVTILPTAVAWQFSSLMTNDSVGERPGGYQKSLDARVLKTTCLFRLSPDTWQGLSSRLPLNATSEAIACPADSAANSKRAPVLFIITFPYSYFMLRRSMAGLLLASEYSPSCAALFLQAASISSCRRSGRHSKKVSPSCITRWSQPDSLRSGSKALPVP